MNNLSSTESLPQEDRRPIPFLDGRYEIDLQGNVYAMAAYRHLPAGRTMRVRVSDDGYSYVSIYWQRKVLTCYIHRLLMEVFSPIDNSNEMEVNHIDGKRSNNRLDNLE